MDFKFTIFTPVYNGEFFIERVFNSLKNSSYRNFEWIIINDGSTDNSHQIISQLITKVDWDITYINWEKNKGKHFAWNYAASIAKGDLWLPIDCDDAFIPESLTFYNNTWNTYHNDETIYGIDTLCFYADSKKIIGTPYPYDGIKANFLELKYIYNVTGEKWGCVRMNLIKKYPFPELPGHFFTGPYLWNILGKTHKTICFNKPLRAYYVEPTSICHRKVINIDTINMFIYYNKWLITNYGGFIWKHSKNNYLKIFRLLFSLYSKRFIMNKLHAKEIIQQHD